MVPAQSSLRLAKYTTLRACSRDLGVSEHCDTRNSAGAHTFGQPPSLPEVDHEIFEILETQRRCSFVDFLPIEGLTETPARVTTQSASASNTLADEHSHTTKGFHANGLLLLCPLALHFLSLADAGRRARLSTQDGYLHAFEHYLIVQGSLCTSAERHNQIHEIWVLRSPLIRLSGPHAPSQDGSSMFDTELLVYQLVLRFDIVKECNLWPRSELLPVRWRGGLSIAKESYNNDEVVFGVQRLVLANEPLIVRDRSGIPTTSRSEDDFAFQYEQFTYVG